MPGIGPDALQSGQLAGQLPRRQLRPVPMLHIRRVDDQAVHQPQWIDDTMAFAPRTLGLDRLSVDDHDGGGAGAPCLLESLVAELVVQSLQPAIVAPLAEGRPDRAQRRQAVREAPPGAANVQ